jgi:cytochrome b6-f complex iron-sulfur subunit
LRVWFFNSKGANIVKITRREFLILTASFAAGCEAAEVTPSVPAGHGRVVNAGPASKYAADGVYSQFRYRGFFIVRKGEKLFALSSMCTHKKCRLKAEPDRTFYCPCHGSTFDPNGHVTEGPARRDLPVLETSVDGSGQLMVTVPEGT